MNERKVNFILKGRKEKVTGTDSLKLSRDSDRVHCGAIPYGTWDIEERNDGQWNQ